MKPIQSLAMIDKLSDGELKMFVWGRKKIFHDANESIHLFTHCEIISQVLHKSNFAERESQYQRVSLKYLNNGCVEKLLHVNQKLNYSIGFSFVFT